jgi:hypothetical protein
MEDVKINSIVKQDAISQPDSWIESAIDKGLSIEHLERLMVLKKEWDSQEARKAFDEAMSKFQSECPAIKKTKRGGVTKDGQVAYYYAPIENIEGQTKELRSECGFSYLIKTEFPEGKVRAFCEVRHIRGHSETSMVEMPLLTKTGVMSDAQVTAGTITFCKRYAFCDAFGIMTQDDDTDGMSDEIITDKLEPYLEVAHKSVHEYLYKLSATIEKKSTFEKWLNEMLPSIDSFNKMKELSEKVPDNLKSKYWLDFVKQNRSTVDNYLNKYETALNKKGETK